MNGILEHLPRVFGDLFRITLDSRWISQELKVDRRTEENVYLNLNIHPPFDPKVDGIDRHLTELRVEALPDPLDYGEYLYIYMHVLIFILLFLMSSTDLLLSLFLF